jgi:hypothetical protein
MRNTCLAIFVTCVFLAMCKDKKPEKEVIVIPPNALFVINSQPIPAAYKVDTIQPWVILDSTEALKALLKSVEDNFKRAVAQQQAIQQQKK